jgi:hypothetical protein
VVGEIWLKLFGWPVDRRLVVLRGGCGRTSRRSVAGSSMRRAKPFRIFVTNRCESAEIIPKD